MIMGHIGVDLIKISRVQDAINQDGDAYLKEIFTDRELELMKKHQDPVIFAATRFAAKEAVFKALGIMWEDSDTFTLIEILPTCYEGVHAKLSGRFAHIADSADVSLSWDTDYAIAVAQINKYNNKKSKS